jgi:hypothetical protein
MGVGRIFQSKPGANLLEARFACLPEIQFRIANIRDFHKLSFCSALPLGPISNLKLNKLLGNSRSQSQI